MEIKCVITEGNFIVVEIDIIAVFQLWNLFKLYYKKKFVSLAAWIDGKFILFKNWNILKKEEILLIMAIDTTDLRSSMII